jgi:hypothetical protein
MMWRRDTNEIKLDIRNVGQAKIAEEGSAKARPSLLNKLAMIDFLT